MPEAEEDSRPEELEEDGGGPVKSFLDHLEDLRWTLIRCVVVVMVAMVACLAAANRLMDVLTWPLKRANQVTTRKSEHFIRVQVETNIVGTYKVTTNWNGAAEFFGSNQMVTYDFVPRQEGSNLLLVLQRSTNSSVGIHPEKPVILQNLGPAGAFIVAFQLAIYGGVLIASPLLIYFIGQFVLPALKLNEKKYILRGLGIGSGLFAGGVAFCYFVLMPLALAASQKYSNWLGIEADRWRAEEYIGFVCKFMLGMGLGFEMPVILLILVKLNILDYEKLKAFRKYMIVVNLILGAVLTTPEVLTQVMMAIPLQVLYEITILIAWYWDRQDKKRLALEQANGG